MKRLSTLCVLFFSFNCFSQAVDTSTVLIRGCRGITRPVKVIPPGNELTCKVAGLTILPSQTDTTNKSVRIRLRCNQAASPGNEPLIIIDGLPAESKSIRDLNPNDIESIVILKNAEAIALYGSGAVHGVVVITTKEAGAIKIRVRDVMDNSGIAGATLLLVSADKKDSLLFAADDSGIVFAKGMKTAGRYEMVVSAVGYKTINQKIENSYRYDGEDVKMKREIKNCKEVVVMAIGYGRVCGRGNRYRADTRKAEQVTHAAERMVIYPSPVQKGQVLNLQLSSSEKVKIVRIVNAAGREMLRRELRANKGDGHFQLSTDAR